MSLKQILVTLGVLFVIVLAAIVGLRLSEQAMAVVVGVICGAMASIPMSILVLVALQRLKKEERERYPAQPPVVIVNPGSYQSSRFSEGPYFPLPGEGIRPRDFKIIGHEGWVEAEDGERR